MKTEIFVATHKPIRFRLPDEYYWVQVNAAHTGQWDNYLHDNDGQDNISIKNPSYCELTVLYKLWKESSADFVGLCHYRRFFGQGKKSDFFEKAGIPVKKESVFPLLLRDKLISKYLDQYDILLGRPYCPFPLNVYEDLLRFVYPGDIEAMICVIEQHSPEYAETLQKVLCSKSISYCNMFVSRRETTDRYCTWLFDVLGRIEKEVDISTYDTSHTRIFGYLAEVLLNVYVQKNQLSVKTIPMLSLDEESTPISFKRKLFIAYNRCKTLLHLMPERWAKSLWKSRYDFLDTGIEPYPGKHPVSLNSLRNYFNAVGGQNITVSTTPVPYVRSEFDKSALYAFLCDNSSDYQLILSETDHIRHLTTPFGAANNTRIYPTCLLTESIKEAFINHGFYYAGNERVPFYYAK